MGLWIWEDLSTAPDRVHKVVRGKRFAAGMPQDNNGLDV